MKNRSTFFFFFYYSTDCEAHILYRSAVTQNSFSSFPHLFPTPFSFDLCLGRFCFSVNLDFSPGCQATEATPVGRHTNVKLSPATSRGWACQNSSVCTGHTEELVKNAAVTNLNPQRALMSRCGERARIWLLKPVAPVMAGGLGNPAPKCQMANRNKMRLFWVSIRKKDWDFPGGPVVRNPPDVAGDTGSIPVPGRSHMPWSN